MKDLSPIVLFTYCRVDVTKQTVESLLMNSEAKDSILYVYSDSYKNENSKSGVIQTREYIHSIKGFKKVVIIERGENWGLANNLIDGITSVINQHGKAIVLEDDTIVSKFFLKFMNEALYAYENDLRIATISGYNYEIPELPECYFSRVGSCWGWATWKRVWDTFNSDATFLYNSIKEKHLERAFNDNDTYPFMAMLHNQAIGKVNSWAIRWHASTFIQNLYHIRVGKSLVSNAGFGLEGSTHCSKSSECYSNTLTEKPIDLSKLGNVELDMRACRMVQIYQNSTLSFKLKIKRFLNRNHLELLLSGCLKSNRWNGC